MLLVLVAIVNLTLVSGTQFPATDAYSGETIIKASRLGHATKVITRSCGTTHAFLVSGHGATGLVKGSHFIHLESVATIVSDGEFKRLRDNCCHGDSGPRC